MDVRKDIKDIVKGVLEERFTDVIIESIDIEPDVDEDGDPILRIRIVFDANKKTLDPRRASGLLRHMRPRMADRGVLDFPILSFIAKSELQGKNAEAI